MSGQGYEELNILNRKIDELLIKYNTLKTENENLKTERNAIKALQMDRETEMKELEKKYERLKFSGALLGNGENVAEAKKKITELVREIDRCIALLNR